MKKLFLLLLVIPIVFISCGGDDDESDVILTKDNIIGTWNVIEYATSGEFQSAPNQAIYIQLKSDDSYFVKFLSNTYIGTYTINGNTVKGITTDPITEYFKFDSLDGNSATISYTNSDGGKYKFKAIRK